MLLKAPLLNASRLNQKRNQNHGDIAVEVLKPILPQQLLVPVWSCHRQPVLPWTMISLKNIVNIFASCNEDSVLNFTKSIMAGKNLEAPKYKFLDYLKLV